MMGYTTPHARKLYRILSKKAFLFTEMIPSKTLIHSERKDLIINNNNAFSFKLVEEVNLSNFFESTLFVFQKIE